MTDYSVQNWVNGSAGKTPITADRLNHMELGIYRSHVELDHLDQQFRASLDDILFQVGQYAKLINGGGLQAYWDSIAKIQSQRTDIVVIGDSISEGVGTNQWSQRFPVALQTLLRTQHSLQAPQAAGDLPVHDYSGLTQPNLTISGYPAAPSDQYGLGSKALGIFQDTTVTYTFTGTNFHMFYGWYPDYTNSTECVVTIDGGAPTVVVAKPEPVGSGQFWASPFLTYGTHTVTVKGRSAIFPFMLERFVSYGSLNDNAAGIHVFDGSHGGWATNNFVSSAGEYAKRQWQVVKTINPVLTIINLGTNDIAFGTSAAQLKSNLEGIIEELLYATNKPHSVLLVIPFRHVRPSDAFPNFQEDWDAYRAAIKSLAGENVAVMDLDNVWPKLGPNDPKGVMYETGTTIVHPNQAGHALLVSSIAGALSKPSTAIVAAASDEAVSEALQAPLSSAVLSTVISDKIATLRDHPLRPFFSEPKWADVTSGNPTQNHRAEIQAAITALGSGGGRICSNKPLRFNIQGGPLLIPSRVVLDLPGSEFRGDGTNTIIETGWWNGSTIESTAALFVDSTDATITDGNAAQHCSHTTIRGIKFTNCLIGARLQWFVNTSSVEDCWFDDTCTSMALRATCSWSSSYRRNTFKQKVMVSHFADGMTFESNEWEACPAGIGLEVGERGSWTLRVVGNMFHWITAGEGTGIKFTGGVQNTVIEGNHFESNKRHIYGGNFTCRGLSIRNNHLAATQFNRDWVKLIAVEFLALRNSTIGPNDYELAAVTEAEAVNRYVVISGSNSYYNEVILDNAPGAEVAGVPNQLAMCDLVMTTRVRGLSGSNNASFTQMSGHEWAGTRDHTIEKYIARHRFITDQIPHCTLTKAGSTHHIDTFVDSDTHGVRQPVVFNFRIGGSTNTFQVSGMVNGKFSDVQIHSNTKLGGTLAATVTASNNAGKLRISVAGLDDPSSLTGVVKAL